MSNSTLNLILASNKPELFKKLLKKKDIDYKEILYYLIKNNSVKVAKDSSIILTIYTKVEFNDKEKIKLVKSASCFGFINLIIILYHELKNRYDYNHIINATFMIASKNGHIEVVKLMLADSEKRLDPSTYANSAIQLASENGHTEVVKLLLANPKVDPSDSDDYAIKIASLRKHDRVIKLLSLHPKLTYPKRLDLVTLSIIVDYWLARS